MRIGVLTFHRAYNNGAFLQCFSLQNALIKRFPNSTVEIIDYCSKNMREYYHTNIWNYFFGAYNTISNYKVISRLKHFYSRCKSIIKGDPGLKKYFSNNCIMPYFHQVFEELHLSSDHLVTDNFDETISFLEKQGYDLIIVGSDAIWNDNQTSSPNVFFLSKKISAIKMSYAASCYGFEYDVKSIPNKEIVKESLLDFRYIGVRDLETEKYISCIDKQLAVHHNCDPTLLLDLKDIPVDSEDIMKKLAAAGIDIKKPIVGVMGNSKIGKFAKQVCGEEVQLVALFYENENCKYSLLNITPFEWAIVFGFFCVTFTSFFHGTIFSLKNGTPTITIEQNYNYASKHITKTKDLLIRLGLDDYYVDRNNQSVEYISKLYQSHLHNNQRERIMKALSVEAKSSDSFFKEISNIVIPGKKE